MFDIIKKILIEAGEILRNGFHGKKEINFKGKIDLVTNIDIEVENFIKDKLAEILPTHTIVAEESKNKPINGKNLIFLDPIDGTTNFVHGFPFVSISLAIFDDDKHYGFVYNPIMDELFYAAKGNGAFLNGQQIQVSNTKNLGNALVATGFPYTSVEENIDRLITQLKSVLKNTRGIRRAGSAALDLCYLAKGVFDCYYESNLKPWDVAAGKIIVKEAGGIITNIDGEEHDLLKDKYIIASNPYLLNDFLRLLNAE